MRRNDKSLSTAPLVSYSTAPPLELRGLGVHAADAPLGFLSIAVDEQHVRGEGRVDRVVGLIANYRTFVLYHVMASKSHMHARMRQQVNANLQVLNRAVPDRTHGVERKTAAGRTFKRSAGAKPPG